MEAGLYPGIRGSDLSHEQSMPSEVFEVKWGSRKTTLVALWKMDLEGTRSQGDQLGSCCIIQMREN